MLAAIARAGLVVVDVRSDDGATDFLVGDYRRVRLLRLATPSAWAATWNVGVGVADGEVLVFTGLRLLVDQGRARPRSQRSWHGPRWGAAGPALVPVAHPSAASLG